MKRFYKKLLNFLRLRDLELRKKIVIYHSLLLLIPLILLYFFITKVYVNNRETEILSANYQVSQMAMSNIDNYFQQIQELTKNPLYNSKVLTELESSDNITKAANNSQSIKTYVPKNMPDTESSITIMANSILSFNKYIQSVIVTDMYGNYVYRIIDNSLIKPYNPLNEYWYNDCLKLDGKALMLKTFNIMDYVLSTYYQNKKEFYVFSAVRMIKETNSNMKIGTIMININMAYFADICANVRSLDGERVLVLDGKNNICYDTEDGNITRSIYDAKYDLPQLSSLNLSKDYNTIRVGVSNYIVTSVVSSATGWKLVRILPESQLYGSLWALRDILSFSLLAFIVISMLLSISITYSITKPLNKLIYTIHSINGGDFSRRFKVQYNDEVGQLGHSFNNMMDMIDNLVNSVHVSQIREREAELQALQAQINPHFIYNTLESIRQQAKASGNEPTAQMVFVLGKLLRYSINIKSKIVTVKDEIEHLNNYLFLLNYRFDNKFKMVIQIDAALYDMKMIKLIFQPIVENAIYHGLETKDEDGVILLTGSMQDGRAVFEIEDNGCGMTAEQVEQLSERINDFSTVDQTEGSIGLKNINERIKLQYGDAYGLTVFSQPGSGTTVAITLPVGMEKTHLPGERQTC